MMYPYFQFEVKKLFKQITKIFITNESDDNKCITYSIHISRKRENFLWNVESTFVEISIVRTGRRMVHQIHKIKNAAKIGLLPDNSWIMTRILVQLEMLWMTPKASSIFHNTWVTSHWTVIQQNQTEIYVINHKKNQPSHPFKTTTPRE